MGFFDHEVETIRRVPSLNNRTLKLQKNPDEIPEYIR
jgi:hypothetical protein